MTRHKVTRIEMGRIVREMLGGGSTLPRLTEEHALFLQSTYEVVESVPVDIRTPPAAMPPQVLPALRQFMLRKTLTKPPPRFFIDGNESKKH